MDIGYPSRLRVQVFSGINSKISIGKNIISIPQAHLHIADGNTILNLNTNLALYLSI